MPGRPAAASTSSSPASSTRRSRAATCWCRSTCPPAPTAVRVKYCFDQPDAPAQSAVKHTLDLGLYEPLRRRAACRAAASSAAGAARSHPDVTLSPQGFSSEAEYLASPKGHVAGRTTRGFRPGRDPPGPLVRGARRRRGRAAGPGRPRRQGRLAGGGRADRAIRRSPTSPTRRLPTTSRPAQAARRLVHGRPARPRGALGARRRDDDRDVRLRVPAGEARLPDADGLRDDSALGRDRPLPEPHRGKLVGRSSEVITYRGHTNNQLSGATSTTAPGRSTTCAPTAASSLRRPAQPASRILARRPPRRRLHAAQPPDDLPVRGDPLFALSCRGCSWDYSARETRYRLVDAIEVNTGPQTIGGVVSNPFTVTAVEFYEDALARGAHAAALGVSDSHNAGRTPGGPTRVPGRRRRDRRVRARAVRARAALRGPRGAHLREGRRPGRAGPALHRAARQAPAAPRSSATRSGRRGSRSPRGRSAATGC